MKSVLAAVALVSFVVPALGLACDDGADPQKLKKVTLAEVTTLRTEKKVTLVDANGDQTRSQYGVIPGATLLTSVDRYDVRKELPASKDASLVFYCANERCTASHMAAARAAEAGYTHVAVMPEGIMGWKKSGQPVAAVPRS